MSANLFQSAGITLFIGAIFTIIYAKASKGNGGGLRLLTKVLIFVTSLMVFFTVNLYSAIQSDLATRKIIDKYASLATVELITLLHSNAKVEVGEGIIIINRDTDSERDFVILHEPVFTIMDRAKLNELQQELNEAK